MFHIHSMNHIGRENMMRIKEMAGHFLNIDFYKK